MSVRADRQRAALLGALVAVALGQGGVGAARTHRSSSAAGAAATAARKSPSSSVSVGHRTLTDEIPDLETLVVSALGHDYVRPVKLLMLDDVRFDIDVSAGSDDVEPGHDAGATYQALGLVQDGAAFDRSLSDASDVLGFYKDGTDTIEMRTGPDTPYRRGILAHELTHALQDQVFDLSKLHHATRTSDEDAALAGLVEGEAVSVENDYRRSLSIADQKLYDQQEKQAGDAGGPSGDLDRALGADDVLGLLVDFPYDYGDTFVDELHRTDGIGYDKLFATPPRTTLAVLDPERWDDDFSNGIAQSEPTAPPLRPPAGHPALDDDTEGSFFLYALLGRTDLDNDHRSNALEWWDGDRLVTWRDGARDCAAWIVRADTAAHAKSLRTDLAVLARTRPHGATALADRLVTMTVCG